ncbi:MAG: hypothetical protein ABI882_09355 [Acidobacteriota bacterium]
MKINTTQTAHREPTRLPIRLFLLLKTPSTRSMLSFATLALVVASVLMAWPNARAQANLSEIAQNKIITTAVGGGYSSSAPAKQAPISLPIGVVRDTQGRGLFFIDDIQGSRLLRFLNTSQNSVTLAGATIKAGEIGLIAGGGNDDAVDGANPREVYLGGMNGMVVHPSGNIIFFGLPILSSANVMAINLSTLTVPFGERPPLPPGKLAAITFASLPEMRTLALGPNDKFYTISTCCGNQGASPKVFRINSSGDPELIAGGGNPPDNGNGDGGPANQARLVNPTGIAFDSEGSLLISEGGSSQRTGGVRKVGTDGIITSILSDLGFVTHYPVGITVGPNGIIYVAIGNGERIIRIDGGSTTTIAGDGTGFSCNIPSNPTCGDGGPATSAALNLPGSASELSYQLIQMSADANGLYFPDGQRGQDTGYSHIRYVNRGASPVTIAGTTIAPQAIDSIAGSGRVDPFDGALAQYSSLNSPHGIAVDANDNLFIMDTLNHRLRFVNRSAAPVTIFPGTVSSQTIASGTIATLNRDVGQPIPDDRILTAFFDSLQGITVNSNGVFLADAQNGIPFPGGQIPAKKSGLIRFLNTSAATVTFYPGSPAPVAVPPGQVKVIGGLRSGPGVNPVDIGDGGLATAAVIFTGDVAVDGAGNIYVADYQASRIRRINANTGIITTILEGLAKPTGVAFDGAGRLLVADTYNNRIMRQNGPGSADFSVIGDGSLNPPINRPRDIAVDASGRIYVVNSGTNRVLELNAPNQSLGTTSSFAGSGAPGLGGDGGPAADAQLSLPNPNQGEVNQPNIGIAILKNDSAVLFSDTNNHRIRQVTLAAPVGLASNVSAASFKAGASLAPESIVAVFGSNFATGVAVGGTIPLPTTLLGTTIKVRDSGGIERLSELFFVSPTQCNYLVPAGTSIGPATVTVTSGDGKLSVGTIQIAPVAPGLFTVNSSGSGLLAAYVLRVVGTQQTEEPIVVYNPNTMAFDPIPIDLGPANNACYLVLYGTGVRFRSSLSNVVIKVGGITLETLYAGPAGGFVGLDQLNPSPLPRTLIGAGLVNVEVTVDGVVSNLGTVSIK